MDATDPRLIGIEANVKFALEQFGPLSDEPFGLDRPSVAWVEGYIERMRVRLQGPPAVGIVHVIGSFLGQAIIAAGDGQWADDPGRGIGIRFANGDWCFPFSKVEKQFADGLQGAQSILSFYNIAIEYVAKGKLRSGNAIETPDR